MKKKLLLSLMGSVLLSFLTFSTIGQSYVATYNTDAGYPGTLNTEGNTTTTGWNEILAASLGANQWSSAEAIPFPFDFYGSPVTHFIASGNGLVTFDTTVIGNTPPNANVALPDPGVPDKTIACFWDEFTGSPPTGSNDRVYTKEFGTAPNRQLWIRWFSYEWGPTGDFNYVSVVLEETSNKIYIVDVYNSSSLVGGTTTVGIQVDNGTAFTEGNTISLAGNGFATGDEDYYEYTFFAAGACLPPTNLATANITSNSADVSWTTGGAANWQVQYGPAGFTPGSGTFAGTSSNPYTITGLSANTNYDVYVRDSCGVGDVSAWAGPVSFTTLCTSQLSGSYTINSALPTGGTNFASFADALLELNGCGVSGAVTFSISAGTYTENIYLGNITGSSSSNTVTFDGGSAANVTITYSSSNDTATVYLSGTGYVTFTNMTIANTSTSDGWGVMLQNSSNNINITNCVIDMPVTSTTDIIGIVASNDNSFETSTGDNTNFLTVSGCTFNGGETGIHLTGGSSSATANTGNKIMNNVFRQQDDHAIEVDGQVNLTVSGNDIDNLVSSFADAIYLEDVDDFTVTANTVISPDWGLYVIDGNDGTGTTTRSLVANNMIISNTDYPIYLNDVEQVDVFHNSTFGEPAFAINDQDNVDIRNNVFVSTNDHAFYSLDPLTANDVVDYNVYNTGATVGFDIGPNDYNTLSDWQTAEASYNVNSLEGDPVFVGPTDLHLVGTIADNAGVPLASVTADIDGDVRSGTTPDIGADEYSAPSCSPSTALTASNITSTSVDLSWTAGGGTSFNLEYGPSGFGSGNGTVVNGVANPYTLSGLNPQTTYDFYIQDDCGAGGTSPWSGPVSFTTLCAPLTSFPWTEDFETSQNSIPACWENETNDDEDWIFRSGSIGHGATTDNTTGTAAGYYAGVDDSQSSANDTVNNLLTPSFDLTSLVAPRLNFHYFIGNDNILTSKLVIDVYDGTTWNMGVATINFTQAAWLPYTLDLTAYKSANSRIRFRGVETTDFNSDISIDDVIVEETPSCAAPTALGATNITDVSADLYWTGGGAANWNIEYGPTGFSLGAGTAVNATNDTTNISGLMAGTTYDFYVRDSCGVGDVSAWVGPFSFNTALCPPADQCTYTFDLGDTFGDGWNGNEIGVMQNGVMVATGLGAGFTTGSTFQETVALCDSVMAYVVVTNDGAFNAECFLDVSDPFGVNAASYASGSQFDLGDTLASFFVVCTPPACPDPLSLGITNNGDVSTDLYWTDPVGSVSAWEVEYGPTGFTQGTGTLLNATNDTATASALTASTTYDFYVRSDCGGGLYSAWIGPFTWTTQPCSVNDQCSYVFDLGDTFGDGWNGNEIGVMQNGVMVATSLGNGFTTGSTFGPLSVALCDSIMAYVVVTVDGAFNGECFFDVTDPFGVAAASFPSGSQFDLGDTLASFFVSCTPPACADPTNLAVNSVTSTTANLSWNDFGTGTDWTVEYGPVGFTQGTGTITTATTTSVNISGLMPNTTYDFYVRANCGGPVSAWVGPFTFTTACTPFVAPYTENFDGNTWVSSTSFNGVGDTIDNCWDRNNDPNLYSWTVRGPGTVSFTTGPAGDRNGTGKYVMIEGSNGSSGNVAELYTPLVDVSALVRPELAFFFHTNVNPGDSIFVDIQDSAGVWNNKVVAIGQLQTAQTDAYEKATVDLSPYGDTVQARFRSVKSTFFNGDMAIDDISFDNAPLCPEPSLVSITGVTSSAVFFGFNSSNTSFNFEVGPVGFTQGTGTVSSGGNPGTVGGLMPNTTYDLYIQTDCSGNGNGTSSWIGPFTFTTLCAPLVAPYYEDFSSFTIGFFNGIENCVTIESDNPGTTPSGGYSWEVRNTAQTTSGTGTGPDRDNTLAPAIGGKFVTADVSGSSIGQETRLLTPLVDITALTAPELEYYYHMHGTNMADLHVDIWDGTQWLLDQHLITGTQNISQSDPYNDTILDLSTYNIDTIQVRFRVTSNGCCSGDVAIDDIRISDPLSCNSPNNLSVTGVTSSDALFSWTPDPTAPGTDFVVSYGAGISSPTAGITAAVTGGTNFQLTALMPNTTYCAYVREVCAPGDSSFWSGPVCFTTACVPTTAPYFEDFELFTIGHFDGTEDCWSFEANNPGTTPSGNYSWEVRNTPQTTSTGTGPDRDHTLAPATGGVFITADVSGSSSGNDSVMLVSPLVDISSLTVPELSFWYHKFGVNMPDLNVDVWDGTWHRNVTTIAGVTQNASSDPYLRAAVDLTNFNDTVQVRFRVISLGCCQGDVAIDDVNFDESPACPDPTGLGVFNITGSSADIYWTSGSQTTSTTVQFGPVGFTPGTGTNVVTTNDTVTITGLALTTQYDVYIQDSCSNDTSKWIGPITFATPACLPGSACTHELMLYDTFGDGWNGAVITLFQAGSSAGSFGSAFTNGDTLGPISVQLCDGVPLDIVLTATGTFSNEIEYQLFDPDSNVIASHTATTGLVNGDTLSTAIAISCGSCPAPTAVSVSSITTNSASVSWTSGSTTTTSYIEYGPCGFTPGTGTIVSSISSPANLSGLMANTCYTACVYDICSTGDTSVAGCTNFNTQSVPCPSAGADNSGIVCDTLTAVDLSTYLDATANAGGTWVDASATGALTGSIFDPSVVGGQTGPVTYTFYYTVTATGCPTDSATISITVDTCSIGIDEFLAANLAIYPNPTSSVVYVEDLGIGTQTMTIEVYALNGQLLTSEVRDGNDRAVIDLSRFAKGMYNLKVTTDAGVVIRMISKQ